MKRLIFASLLLMTCCLCAQEAIVSEIVFQENNRTKTTFLQKLIRSQTGAPLDSVQLEKDVVFLKRLPSTSHAYYQVQLKPDGTYKVVIGVQDNFTLIPLANVFTTNDDEFAYRLGLYEYNVLGQNIVVGGIFQRDIFNSYVVNFRAPFLFGRRWGVALNHSNLTTLEPVFFNNTSADYKYNNTSYEAQILYQHNFNHRVELGVNYFTEDYQYQDGATSPDVPQDLRVNKLLYKLFYEYNDVEFYYQYLDGFKSLFNFQYVVSTDQILPDFALAFNDFIYYKRIGERGNWASRLRLGIANNDESPFAPFAVDNNLNIRGVGNVIDRGTAAIVLNTEYRHTLYEKKWFVLQGNVFVDGGSWRNPGGDFGDFADSQNLRIYPGLGLRFIHKQIFNTVFRIDYGYGITQDATNGFVFGIGQYF